SRGRAWNKATSPIPMPRIPLRRKVGKAGPSRPLPNPYAQTERKRVAQVRRQKLASVPPINRAERWPHTTEIENRTVVSKAGNMARTLRRRAVTVQSRERKACPFYSRFTFHLPCSGVDLYWPAPYLPNMSEHKAMVRWQRSGPDFLKGKYSREHTWSFD